MSILDTVKQSISQNGHGMTGDITLDDVFFALKCSRRREAIRVLDESGGEVKNLRELSDKITEKEFGTDFGTDDQKKVYTVLYQNHLEKLEEVGVVATDEEESRIRAGPNHRHFADILAHVEQEVSQ